MAEDRSLEARASDLRSRHVEAAIQIAEEHDGVPGPLVGDKYAWHLQQAERLSSILRGTPYAVRGQ